MSPFRLLLAALVAATEPNVVLSPGPTWQRHTIDSTSQGADGVKLGDLNGDGLPDLVTGWEEGNEVRVYLNPGTTNARATWPQVSVGKVGDPEDAIFTDLDGDGRLEVVSCTEGKTRTVFWHRFTGEPSELLNPAKWATDAFPATANQQLWMQAVAMDVDNENGMDLLLASKGKDGSIGWLQAPHDPNDLAGWSYHPLRPAGWIMSLILQDMNGDGHLDIVFSDRKGARTGVFWLENPGPEANRTHAPWKEHAIGALNREVMFADLADLNGDGLLDVAVAVKPHDVVLCFQQPEGRWREQTLSLEAGQIGTAKAVKATDINGDGLLDLFFTCEEAKDEREGILWLEQSRQGPWKQHPLGGPAGVKFDLMQVLDLDGDGDLDVITCEERDQLGLIWYENPPRH